MKLILTFPILVCNFISQFAFGAVLLAGGWIDRCTQPIYAARWYHCAFHREGFYDFTATTEYIIYKKNNTRCIVDYDDFFRADALSPEAL